MIRFSAAAVVLGLVAYEFLGADYSGPTNPPRPIARPAPVVFEPGRPIERPGRSNATAGSSARTLTIARSGNGFLTNCRADKAEGQCVVDTGAVDPVALLVLSRSDASDAGIDVENLDFSRGWSSTANGPVRTAEAYVSRLQVGPFVVRNAPVRVNGGPLEMPLITTAFLRHFRVIINADVMTISEAGR